MLLCFTTLAAAGPWVKGPGQHYAKVSGNRFIAGDYVDPQVQDAEGLSYTSWSAVLYGEVGIAPGLMVHANLPYLWAANQDLDSGWQYRQRGGGDALVGLDWQLPLKLPASIFVQARLPLYADGDRPPLYPAMGDPNVDLDLQANLGHSTQVGPGYLWGVAEGGFRYRSGWATPGNTLAVDYLNGIPYRGQVGYAYLRQCLVMAISLFLQFRLIDQSLFWNYQFRLPQILILLKELHLYLVHIPHPIAYLC